VQQENWKIMMLRWCQNSANLWRIVFLHS